MTASAPVVWPCRSAKWAFGAFEPLAGAKIAANSGISYPARPACAAAREEVIDLPKLPPRAASNECHKFRGNTVCRPG